MGPYIVYLISFFYWSTFTLNALYNPNTIPHEINVITSFLLGFSAYFLLTEFWQMSSNFAGYWHNPITQLLDVSSPLLIGANCIRVLLRDRQKEEGEEIVKILDDTFWLLQAVASLTIWLKCITFL